uniref:EGF-like domain-containing protein n=1 Tax=Branchiostoma floridae TaxID=7739 RepID=C3Z0U9_BRAFL|eukprot:XP_002597841.1 hypothetical protein BRAFLDRAFT_242983 [Branchiostoma floridae]
MFILGCPVGFYGGNCSEVCACQNGASCHPFNGACKCPDGWKGRACDIISYRFLSGCPKGKYGGECEYNCSCPNNATCHTFNGACKCPDGWEGKFCESK